MLLHYEVAQTNKWCLNLSGVLHVQVFFPGKQWSFERKARGWSEVRPNFALSAQVGYFIKVECTRALTQSDKSFARILHAISVSVQFGVKGLTASISFPIANTLSCMLN